MIDKDVEKAINGQINHEMAAAYNYMAMTAFFEERNLPGFAHWMRLQRLEELHHAKRLFRYLLDRGGHVELEAVNKPSTSYNSVQEVFETALKQEQRNTKMIHELYELATQKKDYPTLSHLQWFIDEQVEEESLMEETLAHVQRAADDPGALLALNHQLGQRAGEITLEEL